MINTTLADVFTAARLEDVSVTNFWILAAGTTDAGRIVEAVQSRQAREIRDCFTVAEDYLDNLKSNKCPPR